jgi:hypothetical protein
LSASFWWNFDATRSSPVDVQTTIEMAQQTYRRIGCGFVFVFALTLLVQVASAQVTFNGAIPINSDAQLFIDDHLIDKIEKVQRQVHLAEKYFPNPVLTYTEPWEGHCVITWGSVIYDNDEGIFKCWYEAYRQTAAREQQTSLCYATSKDGIHWHKPNLKLIEFEGSKDNNILFQPRQGLDSAVIIKDDSDPDPARRYKMMFYLMAEKEGPKAGPWGLYTATSADGIHWTGSNDPLIKAGDRAGFFYNPVRRVYSFFTRPGTPAPITKVHRWLGLWESPDFRSSGAMQPVLWPDENDGPGTEFYSLQPFQYESMILGYLEMFYNGENDVRFRRLDTQLAVSHDGVHWERALNRAVVLPFGLIGSWDGGWAFPSSNPPIRFNNKLYVYYQGRRTFHWGTRPRPFIQDGKTYQINDPQYGHVGSIGVAFLRVDGFASMNAKGEPGIIRTKPLSIPKGLNLLINAQATGSLKVAVLDGNGKPLPGFSIEDSMVIKGDSLEHRAQWQKKGIAELGGQTVILEFHLEDAALFSFRIK